MDLITFNCSSCQQVLKVSADNAGKQAKCPRCGTAMVIPRASSTAMPRPEPSPAQPYEDEEEPRSRRDRSRREDEDFEERPSRSRRREDDYDDEDDRPRRSRRREDDDDDYDRPSRSRRRSGRDDDDDYDRPRSKGMSERKKLDFVRLGLLLVAVAACVLAGAAGLLAIANLLHFIMILAEKDWTKAYAIIGRIGNGLLFGAGIVAVVGYVFCIFVPNKRGTLALAITALSLGAINIIFNLICRIIPMFSERFRGGQEIPLPGAALISDSPGGAFAFSLIIVLLFFAELIIFPIFIWALGNLLRDRATSSNAKLVTTFASVSAGLALLYVIMVFVMFKVIEGSFRSGKMPGKAMPIIASLVGLIAALAFLGQLIYYTIMLFRTRDIVDG